MYSRNFGTFENVSSVKLNNELKGRANVRSNTVPVRNYSDNSAYERFNNLGNNKFNTSSETNDIDNKGTIVAAENNITSNDNIIIESTQEVHPEDNIGETMAVFEHTDDSKQEKPHYSIFGEIHKLTDVLDGDFLLIALAAALIFFGNNETNDKLTPIALLAIMFL